jgi:hypothetical protein
MTRISEISTENTSPAGTTLIETETAAGADEKVQLSNLAVYVWNYLTSLTAKTTLTGADQIGLADSAASNVGKKITWTNFMAQVLAFTGALTNKTISLTDNTLTGTTAQFNTALSDNNFATLAGTETLTGKSIDGDDNTLTDLPAANLKIASQAQGDILHASSASVWARLGAGTSGQVLETRGAAANPVWADPPYLLTAFQSSFSPADATTYYFGWAYTQAAGTSTAANKKFFFPRSGTIIRADINVFNNGGTQGSNETSTMNFRLNDTTDTALTAALTANAAANATAYFNITGLSIAVAAGDFGEMKWVTPTWATNPTNVIILVSLYIS